ncbi:STAS domain-containing protein [Actinoplanes oblitus]|uniref:Anti-sigma factor antagonist n=1 Tax=Actinoplanes oblitus TaxID=3040509 RepID=A0ABY8W6A0_9ACTN|nr:STAS domain-containing protein [Actinoplanes oblitus]WIM92686.1 STAS domain-containing protein [Actinoplanes oblitus]
MSVLVAGELDMATADVLYKALHEAVVQPGVTSIVVDFGGVGFCDSSGIGVLDRAYGEAQDAGIVLRLVKPRPSIRRILELVGLLDTLTGS